MEGGEAGVMAVTKVFAIRVRLDDRVRYITDGEKTSLASGITYISNPEKTEQFFFTSALNCSSVDTALSEMMETKQQFGKMGGVLGYHFIQSFQPGEVTPEQAHAIGLEFAKRLFGKRYEVVISTHLNKHHLHNHLVVNSVSCVDGQKYHSSPESYYNDVRGTSDELCRENDLSLIAPQGKGKHYAEWKAEQGGKPTVRGVIRTDIDAIIHQAYTYDTFLMLLRKNGYEVRRSPNRKYTTVKPPRRKAGDPPGQSGRGLHRSGYSAAAFQTTARRHSPANHRPFRQALPHEGQTGDRPKKEDHRLSRTLSPLPLSAAWGQAEKAAAQTALFRQAGGHSFGAV